MVLNSKEIVKKTEFFLDKESLIKDIEKISDSKYKIITENASYVLGLYDINKFNDIKDENKINNYLENIGLFPLKVFDMGIMPDIAKSYKVFEYRDEISLKDYFKTSTNKENYELGIQFGKILKNIHFKNLKTPNKDWNSYVVTSVNLLLYRHGLIEYKDDKDYILIDYLKENSYLTKNTTNNLLYNNLSDKNIRVYENDKLDIRGLKKLNYGDGISDFVEINRIAINYPDFSRGCIYGYKEGKSLPRKFFRLLIFYQVYAILKSLLDIRENKKSYLSLEETEEIIKMYDEFSVIYPEWLD